MFYKEGVIKFTILRLLVPDYTSCFLFYRDTLGLEPVFGDEDGPYSEFKVGEGLIALFPRDIMADVVHRADLPAAATVQDPACLCLSVDDVDATASMLRGRGVTLVN
ncbi:MAG: VOC family protein [Chloroflexota bacterium]